MISARLMRMSLVLAATSLAGACGLKGALYIPEPEDAAETSPAPVVESPESTGGDTAEDEIVEE